MDLEVQMLNIDVLFTNTGNIKTNWKTIISGNKELQQYIATNLSFCKNDKELLYCLKHNITKRPKCKYCSNDVSFYKNYYTTTCGCTECKAKLSKKTKLIKYNNENYNGDRIVASQKRLNKISDIIQKTKQTKLERYGDENYNNSEKQKQTCLERYGAYTYLSSEQGKQLISYITSSQEYLEKRRQTCLERYGVVNYSQTYDFLEKRKQICLEKYGLSYYFQTNDFKEKSKQICFNKYSAFHYLQSNDFKEKSRKTCLEKYGVEHYSQTEECKNKIINTKQANNTFNTSQPENECCKILKEKYPDVIRQYKDERYPFACDFYIPSKDLFIECNFHWTHGGKPFEGTDEDLQLLQYWYDKNTKYYNNAIYTWTDLDVRKRNIAKENKLKYIEFWDINEIRLLV